MTTHPDERGLLARWAWAGVLALGTGASSFCLSGPADARPWATQVMGLVAVASAFATIRREPRHRRRPWLLFGAAAAVGLVAGAAQVPSLAADGPMVAGRASGLLAGAYVCLVFAGIQLRRLRHPSSDPTGLIDGLVIATAVATLVSATGPADHRATGLLLAPLLLGGWAASALYPDRATRPEASAAAAPTLTASRLALFASVLLVGPAILVGQSLADEDLQVAVAMGGEAGLSALVLARLTLMVRQSDRIAAGERAVRHATGGLTEVTERAEMIALALESVHALAPEAAELRASAALDQGDGLLRVVAAEGHQAAEATGITIEVADLREPLTAALATSEPAWARSAPAPDLGPHPDARNRAVGLLPLAGPRGQRGCLVVSSRAPLPRATQSALEALAGTLALAIDGAALAEEVHRGRSERHLRALVRHSSDLVVVIGAEGTLSFVSPASERLLGRAPVDLLGTDPLDLVHPEDRPMAATLLRQARDASNPQPQGLGSFETRLERQEGTWGWFEIIAHDLTSEEEVRGIVVNCRDVSDRHEAEEQVHRSEARFRALVQNVTDVVAVVDPQGRFSFVSPAVTPLLGYRPEDLLGSRAVDLLTPDQVAPTTQLFAGDPDGTLDPRGFEVRLLAAGGEWRTLDVTATDLRDDPAVGGVVLNARDVTFRRELEQSLQHQAMHDALTGLVNRTRFAELLLEVGERPLSTATHVLLIDLDDFKTLNDSLGHAVGDELLVGVTERLLRTLPTSCTVARLGGDEFAVLANGDDGLGPFGLALRVLNDLRRPFRIRGRELVVTASIGIAPLSDHQHANAEVVLRNADMAMYLAKERGKDRVELFDERMHTSVTDRLELRADLTRAIDDGQLRLVYQPVVDLRTGQVQGLEALVRWAHPQRGLLKPEAFVPLAEQSGMIGDLGVWVLREACLQLRRWQAASGSDRCLTMSVNLSVRQLESAAILDAVRSVIEEHGIDPNTLTLEITETAAVADMSLTNRRLNELKAIGVSLAIDDFGTGYSSLSYVEQFPIDVIKIDRSFVAGVREGQPTPVLQSMVDLAQRLGVDLIAEGIERRDQLEALGALGCGLGQGFLFAAPVEADQLGDLPAYDIIDLRHS